MSLTLPSSQNPSAMFPSSNFSLFSLDYGITIITIPLSVPLIPSTTPANIQLYIHWWDKSHGLQSQLQPCLAPFCVSQGDPSPFTILHHSPPVLCLTCSKRHYVIHHRGKYRVLFAMHFYIGSFDLHNDWHRQAEKMLLFPFYKSKHWGSEKFYVNIRQSLGRNTDLSIPRISGQAVKCMICPRAPASPRQPGEHLCLWVPSRFFIHL